MQYSVASYTRTPVYVLGMAHQHQRPIDKEFEDADDTGVLTLTGRNLRSFPVVAQDLVDYLEIVEAGKLSLYGPTHTVSSHCMGLHTLSALTVWAYTHCQLSQYGPTHTVSSHCMGLHTHTL